MTTHPNITGAIAFHTFSGVLIRPYTHLSDNEFPVNAPLPADDVLQSIWDGILHDPRLYYIVADVDNRLVATCNLTIVPNLTRGARPYGIIENVVTHLDYRQQGFGRQVLDYALALALQQHCYKVMLLSGSKREETLNFYENAGFKRGLKTGFVALPPEEL
ncbi:GNAT family N-acetyltransferase [Nostoc sp. 'Lobaria pulmonaria (5183) cyanobiont']|uniref:GNAT family N-acetyltransferase n=1 Tax=Nostoc sp. 'Lobaria pulmonaria (5183) cyanobiont' TaxID=1618022 RepID=UPI002D77E6F5|nr:GNAT family N-acetyltransferase [Nostoc sp. 'Lobaria pulmonaria (5183) cyanobiont']